MKSFLIALQFLTVLPVKIPTKGGSASSGKSEIKGEDFGKSLLYFPLIGVLIGLILAAVALVSDFLPNTVKGALILIISIILTGGIHLDGFADTCDGFYAGKSKERILEIMQDTHIGAMGAIGIALLLLLKFSLIVSLQKAILWRALIGMIVFSRWVQVLACSISYYARKEGKAKYFIEHASKSSVFIGGFFTLALFLLLMQLKGLILFFLSMAVVFLFLLYIKRKIGGMTGDTIGAASEVGEVLILLFSSIMVNIWRY